MNTIKNWNYIKLLEIYSNTATAFYYIKYYIDFMSFKLYSSDYAKFL